MVCNTATAAQGLLIVNATENAILNNVEPKKKMEQLYMQMV